MTKTKSRAGESFVVLQGLNWPGARAEAGEIRSDIPPASIEWLLARKAIRPVTAKDRAGAQESAQESSDSTPSTETPEAGDGAQEGV